MIPAEFSACYARLDWADEAFSGFDREFADWMLECYPTETIVEYHAEADIHCFRLVGKPTPPRLGVIASNILHQCRATLDNLVWQLVIANEEKPKAGENGNTFPIWTLDKTHVTFAHRAERALVGVHPDHVALIEGLQPYKRPGGRDPAKQHPLGILQRLSNRDKHQVLQIAVADQNPTADWAFGCRMPDGSYLPIMDGALLPFDRLNPGAVIAWARVEPPGPHDDMQMEFLAWLVLALDVPEDADGPALRFNNFGVELRVLLSTVRGIVDGFRPLETGGEAEPVSMEVEAIHARRKAHHRASPEYRGEELRPWWPV